MKKGIKTDIGKIASKIGVTPLERPLKVSKKDSQLVIGIPKASSFQERRVSLTPESVSLLVARGNEVYVQTEAGLGSNYPDADYTEAGAQIVYSVEDLFKKSRIIVMVTPPTEEEINVMSPGQIIMSPLHLPKLKDTTVKKLMSKKVTCIAYEYLKDQSDTYPMVRTMGEIAGNAALLIASEHLSNIHGGNGILLGGVAGVPPTKVVILGAGVVGEYAARTALGMGAIVKVFDNNTYKLMRLQNNLNQRIFTSILNPKTLMEELKDCNVAIGALHSKEGRSPIIVTENMVSHMKSGAVIIDVSIDQGGCFETSEVTSHDKPTFKKYGVIHYCVPNIASRVSRTGSQAVSHIVTPILLDGHDFGGLEKYLWQNEGARHGLYIFNGALTNQYLGEKFNIKHTDLDLLLAANI